MGELCGVLRDPLLGNALDRQLFAELLFTLLTVMLNLTHLFDHARAEQCVFVDKGNADQVVIGELAAPGDYAGVARLLAKERDAQLDRAATSKAAAGIACHPAEADIVQPLLGYKGLFTEHQLHRHIAGMTQKTTHDYRLPQCHQIDIAVNSIVTELQLTDFDADRRLLDLPGTSLIIFTSIGCASCRWARRELPKLALPIARLAWIDAADNAGLVERYEVFHLPALFVVRDGQFHGALSSRLQAADLIDALGAALSLPAEELP